MSYTFDQMINKLQNGKLMTRPGWNNGQFLMATAFTNPIMYCTPSNLMYPCTVYYLTMNDANANDWIEKS